MGNSFFSNLFSSLFGGNDPEAQKKRQLKGIYKNLSKTRYKVYKPNSNEIDGSFAKIYYDIYKVLSPAQVMFQSMTPNQIKRMVLEFGMTKNQKAALDQLTEQAISENARKMALKDLAAKVKKDLETLTTEFDSTRIMKIDDLYTKLVLFSAFCQYDFYFTLRKFDNNLKERSFNTTPKFNTINGTYIIEDLKNFIDVGFVLPFDDDWEPLFKMLKSAKSVEPVTLGAWKKVMGRIKQLKDQHIFEMLIQLTSENPLYKEEYKQKSYSIVEDFIQENRKLAETTLENLKAQQTAGKVEGLLTQIFGTPEIEPLKYYNEAASAPFERKGIGSYEYHEPLCYLKHFIMDYVKKNVKELSDILLVRGEWINQQLAKPMSDAQHILIDMLQDIIKLDESLNETVDLGLKMKTLLPRTDRDKEAKGIILSTLNIINDSAARMILNAIKQFIIYDKNLKMILEDSAKQHPALIMNWKDLDHFAEGNLKNMCVDTYKKIYNLVQILQSYEITVEDDEEE